MGSKPYFIMMIGLPGSGKSQRAEELSRLFKANIHSSDGIRSELALYKYTHEDNGVVFNILHNRVKEDLTNGKSCIYDAYNISYKRRRQFLNELKKIDCYKICEVVATPYEICLQQNKNREAIVPESSIEKMYRSFDIPGYYEGWDNIAIHYNDVRYKSHYGTLQDFIDSTIEFPQENKFHKDTLGTHCVKCHLNCHNYMTGLPECLDFEDELLVASVLHDCGKPFCKTFTNAKGEITDNAHYYNHERVGAYNSLFYHMDLFVDKHYVALLIRWHMIMHAIYNEYSEKLENKYGKLFGKEMFNDLYLLYKSDSEAH